MNLGKSGFGRFFLLPSSVWQVAAALLLAVFWLLYLHPYHGIRHDSILYLGQALLLKMPQQLSQDLFFAYGSQSQYTLLPGIVAWLLDAFHPSELFKALTFLGLVAFAVASWCLINRLFEEKYRFWALLGILVLPMGYGPFRFFGYGEPFFTGRSLAEPLVLATLAAWLADRRGWAISCWLLAFVIHPLQALVVPILGFSALVWKDRRWWHVLWLLFPVAVLAFLDIPLFSRLAQRLDPQWAVWVAEYTPQIFVSTWDQGAFGYWLVDVFLGWLVVCRATGKLRMLAGSAVIAAVLGLLASLVFADVFRLALVAAAQLWRTQWLLHWLAMASVPWLLARQWREDGGAVSSRWALLLAIVALGSRVGGASPPSLVALALIPAYLLWPVMQTRVSAALLRAMNIFPWVLLFLITAKYAYGVWRTFQSVEGVREAARPEFMLVSHPLIAGALVVGCFWLWQHARRGRALILIFAIVAVMHSLSSWDRRNQWTRQIESAEYKPNIFKVPIENGAQIFWGDDTLASWLILARPQYYDTQQASGVVFNRETAAEVDRRTKILEIFEFQKQICEIMNSLNNNEGCAPDDEQVSLICMSQRPPSYIVLTSKLKTSPVGEWSITGGTKGDRTMIYRLYRCRDFALQVNRKP